MEGKNRGCEEFISFPITSRSNSVPVVPREICPQHRQRDLYRLRNLDRARIINIVYEVSPVDSSGALGKSSNSLRTEMEGRNDEA